jgi:L-seryl-tRNA(Ser) seleniumtransferase
MRRHPLARALRIDKLDLAALDAVLRLYLDPRRAIERVPTLAALAAPLDEVERRAAALAESLGALGGVTAEVMPSVARAGAGALPVAEVPSAAVVVTAAGVDAEGLAGRLRRGEPAVVGRVHDGRLHLDARTLRDAELDDVVAAVRRALET